MKSPIDKLPSAIPKKKLKKVYKLQGLSYERLHEMTPGVSVTVICEAMKGNPIQFDKAKAISEALGFKDVKQLFTIDTKTDRTLSTKTVLEHHRFISSVLSQAEKEMLVSYNAAKRATPPKNTKTHANYYEPETIKKIAEAFDTYPIERRLMGYMLIYTGARRGEIIGLQWHNIDLNKGTTHF